MECSNWSGAESLNLQFMVPKVRADQKLVSLDNVNISSRGHVIRRKKTITLFYYRVNVLPSMEAH